MAYYVHDLFQDDEGTRLQFHVGAGSEQTGTTWDHIAGVGSTYLVVPSSLSGLQQEASDGVDMLIACYRISNLVLPVNQYSISFTASFIGAGGRVRVYNEVMAGMETTDVDPLSPITLAAPDGTIYVGPNMTSSSEITDTGVAFNMRVDVDNSVITVYVNDVAYESYDYGLAVGSPVLVDEFDVVLGPNPDYIPRNYRPISKNFAIYTSIDPGYTTSSVTLHSFSIGTAAAVSRFWTEQVGVTET